MDSVTKIHSIENLGLGGTELYSKDYCLLSGDLREFEDTILPKLKAQGFDTR